MGHKLSNEDAKEMVQLYAQGKHSMRQLAKLYRISVVWVYQILRGYKKNVSGISNDDMEDLLFFKHYRISGGRVQKECVICKKWKDVTKENFYFERNRRIKYSRCRECHRSLTRRSYRAKARDQNRSKPKSNGAGILSTPGTSQDE